MQQWCNLVSRPAKTARNRFSAIFLRCSYPELMLMERIILSNTTEKIEIYTVSLKLKPRLYLAHFADLQQLLYQSGRDHF